LVVGDSSTPLTTGNSNNNNLCFAIKFIVALISHMKNELFPFWAGGWKAYAEAQKKNTEVVGSTTFFGRILRFGRSFFKPSEGPIDKRLF
jgi:hypothetical protein